MPHAPTSYLTRTAAARLGPGPAASVDYFRSPEMPSGASFALIPTLTPGAKPCVYPSLPALARRIHRDRGPDALQLRPDRVRFRDQPRDVTAVYAEDQQSTRVRFIGYAWTDGRPPEALQAALEVTVPAGQVEG